MILFGHNEKAQAANGMFTEYYRIPMVTELSFIHVHRTQTFGSNSPPCLHPQPCNWTHEQRRPFHGWAWKLISCFELHLTHILILHTYQHTHLHPTQCCRAGHEIRAHRQTTMASKTQKQTKRNSKRTCSPSWREN